MTNPDELAASAQQGTAGLVERVEAIKSKINQLFGTATSPNRVVTVTVNASGALQNISFGPEADRVPRAQLAASILSTVRLAQATAAAQMPAIMASLAGENSAAMRYVQEQIPPQNNPAVTPQPQQNHTYQEQRQPRYDRQPEPPLHRPRQQRADSDFEEQGSYMKKGW